MRLRRFKAFDGVVDGRGSYTSGVLRAPPTFPQPSTLNPASYDAELPSDLLERSNRFIEIIASVRR
jgi:hypothetical protein